MLGGGLKRQTCNELFTHLFFLELKLEIDLNNGVRGVFKLINLWVAGAFFCGGVYSHPFYLTCINNNLITNCILNKYRVSL